MEQHTEILLVSVWYSKQYIWGLWLAYSQHMKRLYLLEFLFCPASFWRLLNSAFSSMILRCLFSWKRSTSIGINNRTKSTWRKNKLQTDISFLFFSLNKNPYRFRFHNLWSLPPLPPALGDKCSQMVTGNAIPSQLDPRKVSSKKKDHKAHRTTPTLRRASLCVFLGYQNS